MDLYSPAGGWGHTEGWSPQCLEISIPGTGESPHACSLVCCSAEEHYVCGGGGGERGY